MNVDEVIEITSLLAQNSPDDKFLAKINYFKDRGYFSHKLYCKEIKREMSKNHSLVIHFGVSRFRLGNNQECRLRWEMIQD